MPIIKQCADKRSSTQNRQTSDDSIWLLYADVKLYQLLSTPDSCLLCFRFHPETQSTYSYIKLLWSQSRPGQKQLEDGL